MKKRNEILVAAFGILTGIGTYMIQKKAGNEAKSAVKRPCRVYKVLIKRIADILMSLAGLIILSPVFLVIAVSIKATSKGTVFFCQERLGLNGKVFQIIKFRTMIMDAENMGSGLDVDGNGDARITKIGRYLRNASLDELPQLVNVLKGDMSLVGPRPPAVYFPYNGYDGYPDWAKKRFDMRPGITGLAQVKGRNAINWNRKIVYDNLYIDRFSIFLDIRILLETIKKVFDQSGIYGGNEL